jgi:hypothetical protein
MIHLVYIKTIQFYIINYNKYLLNYLGTSFLNKLISESKNSLNLTDPNKPEYNTCESCNAPLVGLMGVERHGIIFCSTSCVSRCSALADLRADYLSKFGSLSRGFHKAAKTH